MIPAEVNRVFIRVQNLVVVSSSFELHFLLVPSVLYLSHLCINLHLIYLIICWFNDKALAGCRKITFNENQVFCMIIRYYLNLQVIIAKFLWI